MQFNSYIVFLQIAVTQNLVSVIRLSYKTFEHITKGDLTTARLLYNDKTCTESKK